jgi:hypothetical protein
MNRFPFFLVAVLAVSLSSSQATESLSSEPTISAIKGRTVQVKVPAGFERVTLQALTAPKRGKGASGRPAQPTWQTVGVQYPHGTSGVIIFQLNQLTPRRMLQVFGKRGESLPGNLLTGITTFLPEPPQNGATAGNTQSLDLKSGGQLALAGIDQVLGSSNLASNGASAGTDARTVAEADIWKMAGDRLLYFNERRGLQVFDVRSPDEPALLGALRMPGMGEDMYLLDPAHVVLLKKAWNWYWEGWSGGHQFLIRAPERVVSTGTPFTLAADAAAVTSAQFTIAPLYRTEHKREIVIANIEDGQPRIVGRVEFEGTVRESRLVGKVLYLATDSYHSPTATEPPRWGLTVTSFDLHDPANPVRRASVHLGSWMTAVAATNRFFFASKSGGNESTTVDIIDISDSTGAMMRGGSVTVPGTVADKFKMNEHADVLTVVSQKWRPRTQAEIDVLLRTLPPDPRRPVWITASPVGSTEVNTFSLAQSSSPAALGKLELATDETLYGTRFVGTRLYVITAKHKPWIHVSYVWDPLWIVDLSAPAAPKVLGELEMPGFSTYLEPLGDRLVTIGLLDGLPTVSLFDVGDPAKPAELSRVQLATGARWANSEAVRNEKAFSVLPHENLIMLPISASDPLTGQTAGVQLLDLQRDRIVKRGIVQQPIAPRRTTVHRNRILALSPSNLLAIDASNRDQPKVTADVEIAWSVDRVFLVGDHLVQLGSERWTGQHYVVNATAATVSRPDEAAGAIDLPGGSLADAVVRDGVLYVVQVRNADRPWDTTLARERVNSDSIALSALDLSRLPRLSLLGTTVVPLATGNRWWRFPAMMHWINETSLAVSLAGQSQQWLISPYWYDPAPYDTGEYVWMPAAPGGTIGRSEWIKNGTIDPPGRWEVSYRKSNSQQILAFDVSNPARPRLASNIELGANQPWDFAPPLAVDGALYASFRHLGNTVTEQQFATADKSDPNAFQEPAGVSKSNRHFLQIVDYSNIHRPILVEKQANLAGRLVSTARAGRVLFTIGQQYDSETGEPLPQSAALHASALEDGAAYLLDQLPLTSQWEPLGFRGSVIHQFKSEPAKLWRSSSQSPERAVADNFVFAPRAVFTPWLEGTYEDNLKKSTLTSWRLGEDGKFSKLSELALGHESAFKSYGDLGVAFATANQPSFIDLSDPALPRPLGSHTFEGAPHLNYEHAAGALGRGFWVPTGVYGLEVVTFPQTIE